MEWTGEVSLPMCGGTKRGLSRPSGTLTLCLGSLLGWIALSHLFNTSGLDSPCTLVHTCGLGSRCALVHTCGLDSPFTLVG